VTQETKPDAERKERQRGAHWGKTPSECELRQGGGNKCLSSGKVKGREEETHLTHTGVQGGEGFPSSDVPED